jgi:hypothetical protein
MRVTSEIPIHVRAESTQNVKAYAAFCDNCFVPFHCRARIFIFAQVDIMGMQE